MKANEPIEISRDEIARLAYLKWESEGHPEGRNLQHWLDAERLLRTAKNSLASELNDGKDKTKSSKPSNRRKKLAGQTP